MHVMLVLLVMFKLLVSEKLRLLKIVIKNNIKFVVVDPPNVTIPILVQSSSIMGMLTKEHHGAIMQFNITHLFVFLFCGIILIISVFLGAQYIFRYHRYQLAKSKEEVDSPLNTPHGSTVSITRNPNGSGHTMRAISTTTLMSEVVTLVKLKPKSTLTSTSIRHQKLRESVVSQDDEKDQLNDTDSIGNYSK